MILIWIVILIVLLFGATAFFGAPYVPSQRRYLRTALTSLYPLTDKDVLVDIGCGDGLVLREAATHGAKAYGYEINPILYGVARFLCRKQTRVTIVLANFWMTQLPDDTTVIYAFSVTRDNPRLSRRVQAEAERLGRPLTLVCFGSPLQQKTPDQIEGAYFRYTFHPMHIKTLTV